MTMLDEIAGSRRVRANRSRDNSARSALALRRPLGAAILLVLALGRAHAESDSAALTSASVPDGALGPVVVTARLRTEDALAVPVSLQLVDAKTLQATFTNNVQQLALLVPSINYSSPNPRNTALTIRGLGSSVVAIAQANDGLDPGVGFYVDGVYHARPATAAFDFADIDRIEVLRGPQGTLYGKNTTAGSINITSKAPTFTPEALTELSFGNIGYYQAKAVASGPLLADTLAGRISGVVTGRNGVLHNVVSDSDNNDLHSAAARGQLLWQPTQALRLRLVADYSAINSNCCTQVYDLVGTTLKSPGKQYPSLALGLGYAPPSTNPYDRLSNIDAPLKVDTNEGGLAATADWQIGIGTVTAISAWRYWNWDAANDRDYTSLSIQTQQHIPSRQDQYSQEVRLTASLGRSFDYTAGLYVFDQTLLGHPITVYGPLATYWLLGPSKVYPQNLLDGYGSTADTRFHVLSSALFGEATWRPAPRWSLGAGLRYTDEHKDGRYASSVSGGLVTTDPLLLKAQLSILNAQSYAAVVHDASPSGRINVSYELANDAMAYATLAQVQKSGGINMSGLPLDATGQPALNTAVIRPEHDTTGELGVKALLLDRSLAVNADVYYTRIHDYQANVVDTAPGALRGYLANIAAVSVRGLEADATFKASAHWSTYATLAFTDARYDDYANGPCPLELIGNSTSICNLSGRPLPGTPRVAYTLGTEWSTVTRLGYHTRGEWYVRTDVSTRTSAYGDASDSMYTLLPGYTVANLSVGLRVRERWDVVLWARNLFDRNYLQNVTIQAGNSGLVVATPSDPPTWGITWRMHW